MEIVTLDAEHKWTAQKSRAKFLSGNFSFLSEQEWLLAKFSRETLQLLNLYLKQLNWMYQVKLCI